MFVSFSHTKWLNCFDQIHFSVIKNSIEQVKLFFEFKISVLFLCILNENMKLINSFFSKRYGLIQKHPNKLHNSSKKSDFNSKSDKNFPQIVPCRNLTVYNRFWYIEINITLDTIRYFYFTKRAFTNIRFGNEICDINFYFILFEIHQKFDCFRVKISSILF